MTLLAAARRPGCNVQSTLCESAAGISPRLSEVLAWSCTAAGERSQASAGRLYCAPRRGTKTASSSIASTAVQHWPGARWERARDDDDDDYDVDNGGGGLGQARCGRAAAAARRRSSRHAAATQRRPGCGAIACRCGANKEGAAAVCCWLLAAGCWLLAVLSSSAASSPGAEQHQRRTWPLAAKGPDAGTAARAQARAAS